MKKIENFHVMKKNTVGINSRHANKTQRKVNIFFSALRNADPLSFSDNSSEYLRLNLYEYKFKTDLIVLHIFESLQLVVPKYYER